MTIKQIPKAVTNWAVILFASAMGSGCSMHGTFHRDPDFGGSRPITLVEGVKTELLIKPLSYKKFEFSWITLQVWDPDLSFLNATVTSVEFEDSDGRRKRIDETKSARAAGAEKRARNPKSPSLSVTFEEELRHVDTTVTITGYLTTKEGEKVQFRGSRKFKAGTDFYMMTILDDIKGV